MREIDVYEKAALLIEATHNELRLGTKHYRASTKQQISSVREILEAMSCNDLIIEPIPERQHLFHDKEQ